MVSGKKKAPVRGPREGEEVTREVGGSSASAIRDPSLYRVAGDA
jgi:hypothetical protein